MHRVWIQSIFGGMESTITLGASKEICPYLYSTLYTFILPLKKN